MPFKITAIPDPAQLDSAPVALIADYPLERRDYKPYAQCNLCLAPQGLVLRMWAFEVSPPPGSILRAVLYLFADRPAAALTIALTPAGDCTFALWEGGAETPIPGPEGFKLHLHSGEDLQGVYWGGLVVLPLEWLAQLGKPALSPGESIPGNFYKICPGPQMEHWGSWHPADFPAAPYEKESMGELLVVSY